MSSCGCNQSTCGCCDGTKTMTPAVTSNRSGLKKLRYRVGTHGEFLESMKARLSNMTVDAAGADGQTVETFRPLTGLTTRESSDPSIALLDGWATVGDVLTFYQERIANEGYLRTATERRSVLELARLAGYALRPGVASTVYVAYTLDDNQVDPVEIPAGARSQSIPAPGEQPQSFETVENVLARREWNNLQVRLKRPQNITFTTALTLSQIYVGGAATGLKAGDKLLFEFDGKRYAIRVVKAVTGEFADNRTLIRLQPLAVGTPAGTAALAEFIRKVDLIVDDTSVFGDRFALQRAQEIYNDVLLGLYSNPNTWVSQFHASEATQSAPVDALAVALENEIAKILKEAVAPSPGVVTDPSKFVGPLLAPPVPQFRGTAQLPRTLGSAFAFGADSSPQVLVNFEPRLKDSYYKAWSSANVSAATPPLLAVHALRVSASLFGATVQRMAEFDDNNKLKTPDLWKEWPLDNTERFDGAYLDRVYDGIAPGSLALVHSTSSGVTRRQVLGVASAEGSPRTAYGFSGKTTNVGFDDDWWFGIKYNMNTLRSTLVYAQSEPLEIIEESVTGDVSGRQIELAELYSELKSGRWVIVSGERTDIPGVAGVRASELMMLSGLRHGYDAVLAGDKTHTTLLLATSTAYSYKRGSVVVHGNVVKATHGETRVETLGSGNGAQTLQTFQLKQPPLTFVSANTVSGVESTLHVYVNEIEWHEAPTLAAAISSDRIFVTKTGDDDRTAVIFGNGTEGSRLPSGVENIRTQYRNGIGKPGNVKAEQISLVLTKPLGVKGVINPLAATGGADRENVDQARDNAPLAVMSLDRLVSLRDYEDFARTFAGIGKASVRRLTGNRRSFVHLTIAGADDIPIDRISDLYLNLLSALRRYGDLDVPVRVDPRELIALVASVKVKLAPGYLWDPVSQQIRAAVLETFGFASRKLAQPALRCELIGAIQQVEGVAYVDVDAFGGVPQNKTAQGTRRLLTPDEISALVQAILTPHAAQTQTFLASSTKDVPTGAAGYSQEVLIPAQLAVFSPAVPDTLILNQIV